MPPAILLRGAKRSGFDPDRPAQAEVVDLPVDRSPATGRAALREQIQTLARGRQNLDIFFLPIFDMSSIADILKIASAMEAEVGTEKLLNVLFLCTGNSARSIMAEAILNRLGAGKFKAFSAGSHPKSEINLYTLATLQKAGYTADGLRSKSWDEFAGPDAPPLDFVFTVCDDAAAEECPYWPGQPMTAHWGLPDPAAVEGDEAFKHLAFADTFRMLANRISIFCALPLKSLDKLSLQRRLDDIGKVIPAKNSA